MKTPTPELTETESNANESDEESPPLRCWDCNVNFKSEKFLYNHLFHHIKQPRVVLERLELPALKLTLKNTDGDNFEIVSSPNSQRSNLSPDFSPAGSPKVNSSTNLAENEQDGEAEAGDGGDELVENETGQFLENFVDEVMGENEKSNESEKTSSEYGGGEGQPTPPPDSDQVTTDYPKIRIKTTGLLKESLTITEITDENPEGDPSLVQNSDSNMWSTPSLEDPLKLNDIDDNNILSLFNNNTERAKDLGFCTSDSEFISMDRLEDRNRGAMQMYNPPTSSQNPLDSLTGLPMQALAQQVSRLQPSSNGMHQQNVLINIQQFPSATPPYQPPPMYPPHPPQPPMYPPYQYQPPNPMYYPPAPPGYPPQHMPPPQPQLTQLQPPPGMGQPQGAMVPSSQAQQMPQPPTYRQPMPPRQPVPRHSNPGQRMPMPPRQSAPPRQNMNRPRMSNNVMRPRGTVNMTNVRPMRPRVPMQQNGQCRPMQSVKRSPDQIASLHAKRKKFDMLTPDKDDDDCQVICMQPKNTDGGLPQIESVQGGTPEPAESSIMHLSDSITLSVRNPPPKPVSPKKSDAKAVANILATRGITVTATAKPKEKNDPGQKVPPSLPASLNLNGAVSILPAAKGNGNAKASDSSTDNLPTVDLTDDTIPSSPTKQSTSLQKPSTRPGLPFRCDLCPAQYPNAAGLNKHRQNYHKTTSGMCELGIPLVNLRQPGIMQKLSSIGIHSYIPMPAAGPNGLALPVINTRNPGNVAALGATQMLTLGPIRTIPKMNNTLSSNTAKQVNKI